MYSSKFTIVFWVGTSNETYSKPVLWQVCYFATGPLIWCTAGAYNAVKIFEKHFEWKGHGYGICE